MNRGVSFILSSTLLLDDASGALLLKRTTGEIVLDDRVLLWALHRLVIAGGKRVARAGLIDPDGPTTDEALTKAISRIRKVLGTEAIGTARGFYWFEGSVDASPPKTRSAGVAAEAPTRDEAIEEPLDAGGPSVVSAGLSERPLRIVLFQSQPREVGVDYLRSRELLDLLRRRGHDVRLCWRVGGVAAADPLAADTLPVEEFKAFAAHVLLFEGGLCGQIAEVELTSSLSGGTAALVLVSSSDYQRMRAQNDAGLARVGVVVATGPNGALARVRQGEGSQLVRMPADQVQFPAPLKGRVCQGVEDIGFIGALPIDVPRTDGNILLLGDNGTWAYTDRGRESKNPVFGVLKCSPSGVLAIITARPVNSSREAPGVCFQSDVFLANLVEELHDLAAEFAPLTGVRRATFTRRVGLRRSLCRNLGHRLEQRALPQGLGIGRAPPACE